MYSPNIPKEKATAATVAIYCAFQRTNNYENTSTKVLSVQGQSIKNQHKSMHLIASLGRTGVTNQKGGQRR